MTKRRIAYAQILAAVGIALLLWTGCSPLDKNRSVRVGEVEFTMVYVEGGTFVMGCTDEQNGDCWHFEEPCHEVTLSPFYMAETEVTQALWREVMGSNPSHFVGDSLPVENVSWNDCMAFVDSLCKRTGLRFALPTEAQWEYAARGGCSSRHYKYSGSDSINAVAWNGDNSRHSTHAVRGLQPNELGIYDMSGNVFEWCADWYDLYEPEQQNDPVGPATGRYRTLRGGAWQVSAIMCRVSDRGFVEPSERDSIYGLRLVMLP